MTSAQARSKTISPNPQVTSLRGSLVSCRIPRGSSQPYEVVHILGTSHVPCTSYVREELPKDPLVRSISETAHNSIQTMGFELVNFSLQIPDLTVIDPPFNILFLPPKSACIASFLEKENLSFRHALFSQICHCMQCPRRWTCSHSFHPAEVFSSLAGERHLCRHWT